MTVLARWAKGSTVRAEAPRRFMAGVHRASGHLVNEVKVLDALAQVVPRPLLDEGRLVAHHKPNAARAACHAVGGTGHAQYD